jgi:hypothetical protein
MHRILYLDQVDFSPNHFVMHIFALRYKRVKRSPLLSAIGSFLSEVEVHIRAFSEHCGTGFHNLILNSLFTSA